MLAPLLLPDEADALQRSLWTGVWQILAALQGIFCLVEPRWPISLSVKVARTRHFYRNMKTLLANWCEWRVPVCSARFSALKRALRAPCPPRKRFRQQCHIMILS